MTENVLINTKIAFIMAGKFVLKSMTTFQGKCGESIGNPN